MESRHPDKSIAMLTTLASPEQIYVDYKVRDLKNECLSLEDFKDVPNVALSGLQEIMTVLSSSDTENSKETGGKQMVEITIYGTLLALEHFNSNKWTSEASRSGAKDVMAALMKAHGCDNFQEYTMKIVSKKSLARHLLDKCNQDLTKSTWKNKPALMSSTIFLLSQIPSPQLRDYIPDIFRICLLLLDDFEIDNKLQGVRLAQQMIDNTTATELCCNGRADVIFDALQHQLYMNDAKLLGLLLPCLLQCLSVVSDNPRVFSGGVVRTPQKLDDVFHQILTNMELEVNDSMKMVYIQHLPPYIERMGICILRHLHHLLKVLIMLLEEKEMASSSLKMKTLLALRCLIKEAWPRMPKHLPAIFTTLAKLAIDYDLPSCSEEEYLLLKEIKTIFKLMLELSPEPVHSYLQELCNNLTNTRTVFEALLL